MLANSANVWVLKKNNISRGDGLIGTSLSGNTVNPIPSL
jgi:hypothetical protein